MAKKRKHEDTTIPPVTGTVEDIMKALLRTPPPPAGHPSTRKQKPTTNPKALKNRPTCPPMNAIGAKITASDRVVGSGTALTSVQLTSAIHMPTSSKTQ